MIFDALTFVLLVGIAARFRWLMRARRKPKPEPAPTAAAFEVEA